jgi:hypothetical protein
LHIFFRSVAAGQFRRGPDVRFSNRPFGVKHFQTNHGPRFTISLKRSTQKSSAIHKLGRPITPSLGSHLRTRSRTTIKSALPLRADMVSPACHGRKVPILLQKSFCGMGLKFSEP